MPTNNLTFTDISALIQGLATTNLAYLGICVTIILFAGGLFYVFNFKPLQKSIEKQENDFNGIKKDINDKIENINSGFGNLVLTHTKELRSLVDRATKEIDNLKNDLGKKSADSDKKNQEFINKANQELRTLRDQAQSIELNSLWAEHWMWDGMEIHENTLALLIDYMEKALEYKKLFLTNLWFDRVKKTLIKIKKYSSDNKIDEKRLSVVLEKISGNEEEKNDIKVQMGKVFS